MVAQTNIIANRYEIISKLGQGGMGIVYKVYDRLNKQMVALKQLLLSENQLNFGLDKSTDNRAKLRLTLAQEFTILATLRHPNILSVLDYGFNQQQPFYTMTLLEDGLDFKTYASYESKETQYSLLIQLLQALHYLHRRNILHRDLKPDNVFVTLNGQVKIMDFGLAKVGTKHVSTQNENIKGSIMYMAPELFQGVQASIASDLYAFGIMAYEILLDRYPYQHDHVGMLIAQIINQQVVYHDSLPLEIELWLADLLAKAPTKRPFTAYDTMVNLYQARQQTIPAEKQAIRESFLQANTFVGREAELQQLTDALETLDDRNAFFLVGGESGVGKSRLLDELRIQALVRNVIVMRGRGVEGGGLPFQLWRNIVQRLLLLVTVSDFQAGVLKEIVPNISELLKRDIPDAPKLIGHAYQKRIILTIVDLLREVTHPLLLLLEDLQWASESLHLLKQILLVEAQLPQLMVVGNFRHEEQPNLIEELADMQQLILPRLNADNIEALVNGMLGQEQIQPHLLSFLLEETNGNTFFLIEVMRTLAEEAGQLDKISSVELPTAVFTAGMQQLLQRRIQQMGEAAQHMLKFAAVIGRQLDLSLLQQLMPNAAIPQLVQAVAETAVLTVDEEQWVFAHDKLRETILANLENNQLKTLHHQVANAIEQHYPNNKDYHQRLLEHWHRAGHLDKEIEYLVPVVTNLLETIADYDSALALIERTMLRLNQDDIHYITLLNKKANTHIRIGNYKKAHQFAQQAHESATQRQNNKNIALSLQHLGRASYYQGDYILAEHYYQQGLDIHEKLADANGMASHLMAIGIVVECQSRHDIAETYYQQALQYYQQAGDEIGVATMLNSLGINAEFRGSYEEASNYHQQSLAKGQAIGDQWGIGNSFNNLGMLAYGQKKYEQARFYHQQSLQIRQTIGQKRGIANSLTNLGFVYLHLAPEKAQATWQQALTIAQTINTIPLILEILVGFAGLHMQAGNYIQAAQLMSLAQNHPACNEDTRLLLAEFRPQLEAVLAAEQLHASWQQGQMRELNIVVDELCQLETSIV